MRRWQIFLPWVASLLTVLLLCAAGLAHAAAPGDDYLQLLDELRRKQKAFDWPAVAQLLETAVTLNPSEPRHWWELGLARTRIDQFRPAIEAFRRADALGGGFNWQPVFMVGRGEALYQIALCQARLGEHDAALKTLEQSLAAGLRRPKRLLTETKLEALRDDPRLRDMAGAIDAGRLSRDEGYRADLKFLAREMFRLHFDPHHVHARETFDEEIRQLDAEIPQLNDRQILVRFQRLLCLLEDGHTGLRIRNAHVAPVRFHWFDEGMFITGVKAGNERLLGARVVRVNDRPAAEVIKAFEPIAPRDNEMTARAVVPRMWRVMEFHVGLGIAADATGLQLDLRFPDGREEAVRLSAENYRENDAENERWLDVPAGDGTLPLSWQHQGRLLWFEPTADGRVVYAAINGMGNVPRGETFEAFIARLGKHIDDHPEVQRLVLDFRRNGGGNTFLNRPLIQELLHSRLNRPGGLAVLIGRETFSAAQNTITEIERHTAAVFIGEPSGSRPNFIGETVPFPLPYSNHAVSISDLYWVTSSPLDRRMWIAPKLYLPPRIGDFLARRDPALDAAVASSLEVVDEPVGQAGADVPALQDGFRALFDRDGAPVGWSVTDWSDLAKPGPAGAAWQVEQGVLHGSNPRGTWLISDAEYGDFVLKFDWKLGERGNGGLALRSPRRGDPAFDGLELQMVDPRYYPADQRPQDNELTGSFYRAVAPSVQVYKPGEWNQYEVACQGPRVKVALNGKEIQNLNLDEQTLQPERHDGTLAPPLQDRPRRGHIGFQELSRGSGHVEIRNVRIKELK